GNRWLRAEQPGRLPPRHVAAGRDGCKQPFHRTDRQQRMGAWREAGSLVEQVGDGAAGLHGEDIRYYVASTPRELCLLVSRHGAYAEALDSELSAWTKILSSARVGWLEQATSVPAA